MAGGRAHTSHITPHDTGSRATPSDSYLGMHNRSALSSNHASPAPPTLTTPSYSTSNAGLSYNTLLASMNNISVTHPNMGSGAGDGYTSQASNKTDYSTQMSNSDYPTSDEHRVIMPDRSLPIGRLRSRTSDPETPIEELWIESQSSSSTSSIKCDSFGRPISDGSDVNDKVKYIKELCYGGSDVTVRLGSMTDVKLENDLKKVF